MDTIRVHPFHRVEIDDGKVFMLGSEVAAAAIGALDFDTGDDTLYGFYTTRPIEILAIEHIVTEEHACSTIQGIASLIGGSITYAKVTAVDEAAIHTNISGVLEDTVKVPAGVMLYMKTITASTDDTAVGGEGYFIVTYK